MNEQTELLREMRDLLRVMAEPALAKRDEKLRSSLTEIVGRSELKEKSVTLMDGSRGQAAICKEAGIDKGALSRLVKSLREKELIDADGSHPKLVISIPPNFFSVTRKQNE